jgi:hypothetical protein
VRRSGNNYAMRIRRMQTWMTMVLLAIDTCPGSPRVDGLEMTIDMSQFPGAMLLLLYFDLAFFELFMISLVVRRYG